MTYKGPIVNVGTVGHVDNKASEEKFEILLQDTYKNLASAQQPLDSETSKLLNESLWEALEDSTTLVSKGKVKGA